MNKNLLFIFISLFVSSLNAQVYQEGIVREQNSKRKPISGVQVNFSDAVPTNSDDLGKFRLAFRDKKAGDLIFFQEIQKQGYEIVNEKDLRILQISNSSQLGQDIILTRAGNLDVARKEYYNISDKSLVNSFNKEKKKLRDKLNSKLLTQKQFEEQYSTLFEQYQKQQTSLNELADLFARINFDDVSQEYQQAFQLFEQGEIDKSLILLEQTNLLSRMEKRLRVKDRLANAKNVILTQKEANEKEIIEDIQGLQFQGQLYELTFQIEKAERIYDQLLLIDSTDTKILSSVSQFYESSHRYDKALKVFNLIINNPKSEVWRIAKACSSVGNLYTMKGDLSSAVQSHVQSLLNYQKLENINSTSAFYYLTTSITYSGLGEIYFKKGDFEKSIFYYRKLNTNFKILSTSSPNDIEYSINYAKSYTNLGDTYSPMDEADSAKTCYDEAANIFIKLEKRNPENTQIKYGLAVSLIKLGEVNSSFGDLGTGLLYFQEAQKCFYTLNDRYPQNIDFKNGLAIAYGKIGLTNTALEKYNESLISNKASIKILQELSTDYPQNTEFSNNLGITYRYLAYSQILTGDKNDALKSFEKYNQIEAELNTQHPFNIAFKFGLAISCAMLAEFYRDHMSDNKKAKYYFQQAKSHGEDLLIQFPNKIQSQKFLNKVNSDIERLD